MLYRYYYINGKRVDEDQYYAAKARESYNKAALKRAIEYYKEHPFEWYNIVLLRGTKPLPLDIIYFWEQTRDGKQFQAEWEKEGEKTALFYRIIVFIVLGVWFSFMFGTLFLGCE